MSNDLPWQMTAVFLDPGTRKLIPRKVDVPQPGKGEVLVRMLAAPINPSDLAKIGEVPDEAAGGFIPGIEGCGVVVAAGKGVLPRLFLGKRVACSSKYPTSGTWAEFMMTKAGSCFPLGAKISDDQAAMALVNPMTALAFLDISLKGRHRAVVNTAAAGALGKMISYLLGRQGIEVLNIVRNEEGERKLRERGERFVLNSAGKDFHADFREWCEAHRARLVLDAIGGDFVNGILPLLPAGATVLLYGNLSKQKVEFMPPVLVRENKTVAGFFLGHWIDENGMLKTLRNLYKVKKLLKGGMESRVQAVFPLSEAQKAVEAYEAEMGKGKVLLRCTM